MSLQESLQEIKNLKKQATVNVDMTSPTAAMQVANKRQAKVRLEEMFLKTQKQMIENSVFMVVSGDKAEKFAEVSATEFDTYNFSPSDFYNSLANEIPETNYLMRALNPSTVDILSALLETNAMQIGVLNYNRLIWKNSMAGNVIKNKADLVQNIERLITDHVGLGFVGVFILNQATSKVIADDFSGTSVPILIVEPDVSKAQKMVSGLNSLTNRVAWIDTSEVPQNEAIASRGESKKAVKEALTQVKQTVKKEA
jgi:hypothetical protein